MSLNDFDDTPVWECSCGHRNHLLDPECGNCYIDREEVFSINGYLAGVAAGARAVILDRDGNPIP